MSEFHKEPKGNFQEIVRGLIEEALGRRYPGAKKVDKFLWVKNFIVLLLIAFVIFIAIKIKRYLGP